jgi:hypothetical protein
MNFFRLRPRPRVVFFMFFLIVMILCTLFPREVGEVLTNLWPRPSCDHLPKNATPDQMRSCIP